MIAFGLSIIAADPPSSTFFTSHYWYRTELGYSKIAKTYVNASVYYAIIGIVLRHVQYDMQTFNFSTLSLTIIPAKITPESRHFRNSAHVIWRAGLFRCCCLILVDQHRAMQHRSNRITRSNAKARQLTYASTGQYFVVFSSWSDQEIPFLGNDDLTPMTLRLSRDRGCAKKRLHIVGDAKVWSAGSIRFSEDFGFRAC